MKIISLLVLNAIIVIISAVSIAATMNAFGQNNIANKYNQESKFIQDVDKDVDSDYDSQIGVVPSK